MASAADSTRRALARFTLLVACVGPLACDDAQAPGEVELAFTWDTPPAEPVWITVRVEARPDAETPGRVLDTAGPARWAPGDELNLTLEAIPNGDDFRVIAEARADRLAGLRVLYYGVSEPFAVRAGSRKVVEIPFKLQAPETELRPPTIELFFGGEPRDVVSLAELQNASVVATAASARSIVLANDASFSARLTTLDVESTDGCSPVDVGGAPGWRCEVSGWDMSQGLPVVVDGPMSVFARFVDRFGYESEVTRDSVLLDTAAPSILGSTISNDAARPGDRVLVAVTTAEVLGIAPSDAMLIPVSDLGAPPLPSAPARPTEATTYVWSLNTTGMLNGATVTFSARLTDSVGNEGAPADLQQEDGDPIRLFIDDVPPALVDGVGAGPPKTSFGYETGPVPGDAGVLELSFALQDDHPLLLPSVGTTCGAACPELSVGDRRVRTTRAPELDDPAAGVFGFAASLTVVPEDFSGVEQDLALTTRQVDRAGNEGLAVLPWTVRMDFLRPTAARCTLTPLRAPAGGELNLEIVADEPLGAPPTLDIDGVGAIFEAEPVAGDGGRRWTWTQPVDGLEDQEVRVRATLVDTMGNRSDGPACDVSAFIDPTGPAVADDTVTVDPALADADGTAVLGVRHGGVLTATFSVVEAGTGLAQPPRVILAAPVPVELTLMDETPGDDGLTGYRFALTLDQVLHADAEGTAPVRVELADRAGNKTSVALAGGAPVRVDFSPIGLVGTPFMDRVDASTASRARIDGAPNRLWATGESEVLVSFALDEAPLSSPVLTMGDEAYGVPSWSPGDTYIETTLTWPGADGPVDVHADLVDRGGNRSDLVLGTIHWDSAPPTAPAGSAQTRVRLLRAPWGGEETGTATGSWLRACAASVSGPWSFCAEDPAAPGLEPDATVRAYAASTAGGDPVCTDAAVASGEADPASGAISLPLDRDRVFVCVETVDRAGNVSPRALVERATWVASPQGRRPGSDLSNPHLLESVRVAGSRRDAGRDAWEPGADSSEAVARPGGGYLEVSTSRPWIKHERSDQRPSRREQPSAAYDAVRGRVVLFGGSDGNAVLGDTWEWDGRSWRDVTPAGVGPPAARRIPLAWDARRGVVVQVGLRSDVWEWDGNLWRAREVDEGPVEHYNHQLAYDPNVGRVLMYGGIDTSFDDVYVPPFVSYREVWSWDGVRWTELDAGTVAPPGLFGFGMAFDASRDELVLFGGATIQGHRGETWLWRQGQGWRKALDSAEGPGPRLDGRLVYDPVRQRVVMVGGTYRGEDGLPVLVDAVWEWDGATWTRIQPEGRRPEPRTYASAVWDGDTQRVMMIGGRGYGGLLDDQWLWDGERWEDATPSAEAPPRASNSAMAWDRKRRVAVLHGGNSPDDFEIGLWEWNGRRWFKPPAVGGPDPNLRDSEAVWDPRAEVVTFFGGAPPDKNAVPHTWTWDGATWGLVTTPFATTPCYWGNAVTTDPEGRGLLSVAGGCPLADGQFVWSERVFLWDGQATRLFNAIGEEPPVRLWHGAVHDERRGVVVLYGGIHCCNKSESANDLWEWDGSAWTEPPRPGPQPQRRRSFGMTWDSSRQRTVLFGGYDFTSTGVFYGDAWEWDGERFSEIPIPEDGPDEAAVLALTYDRARERLVLFGGIGYGSPHDETWELDGDTGRRPAVQLTVDGGSAELGPATLERIEVRAVAGAEGWDTADGPAVDGARVEVWDARRGAWRGVVEGASDVSELVWSTSDVIEATGLALAVDDSLAVRVVPRAGSASVGSEAKVVVDHLEMLVHYRAPGAAGADCDEDAHCASGSCVSGSCCGLGQECCETDVDCGHLAWAPRCDSARAAACSGSRGVATCQTNGSCRVEVMPWPEACVDRACGAAACQGSLFVDAGKCAEDGTCHRNIDECDDGDPATPDLCWQPFGGCVPRDCLAGCDDGDACTVEDCELHRGCTHTAADCDDGDACTTDWCDPAVGCVHQPGPECCGGIGASCPEDFTCTPWGTCEAETEVFVPGGPFAMGCNEALDDKCLDQEKPQHLVDVPPFAIDRFEVTKGDWHACLAAGLCPGGLDSGPLFDVEQPTFPKDFVSWSFAFLYCEGQGDGRRLCSEAEWEKAARGGCNLHGDDCLANTRIYPWGNQPPRCDRAIMDEGTGRGCGTGLVSLPVGLLPAGASPYGAFDMAGNLREWVADGLHDDFEGAPTDGSIWQQESRLTRQFRMHKGGGGWETADGQRASNRYGFWVVGSDAGIGFRCCRPL